MVVSERNHVDYGTVNSHNILKVKKVLVTLRASRTAPSAVLFMTW